MDIIQEEHLSKKIKSLSCSFIGAIIVCLCTGFLWSADFYVAPNGVSTNDGSINNPWDLQTALSHPSSVKPADTIWLRGGVYTSQTLTSTLNGTNGNNITLRPYLDEHVIIQGGIAQASGGYVTYRDFEVTDAYNLNPKRVSAQAGTPTDIKTRTGISVIASPGVKIINLVIHDMVGVGIYINPQSPGSELYGNIIYHNGWDAPDRPHGHGLYLQNTGDPLVSSENIIFSNSSLGIQAYGSAAPVVNMTFDGNVIFKNNLLIGGVTAASGIQFANNIVGENVFTQFYYNNKFNQDLSMSNNHFLPRVQVFWWKSLFLRDNNFYGGFEVRTQEDGDFSHYSIDKNSYFGPNAGPLFSNVPDVYTYSSYCSVPTQSCIFQAWQSLGFDVQGTQTPTPSEPTILIRPNKYDSKRAHIVVFNWPETNTVAINLAPVLSVGDRFEIRDVQNYFGHPVLSGTYAGGIVSLPMDHSLTDAIKGDFTGAYHAPDTSHTTLKFGAFVLTKMTQSENLQDVQAPTTPQLPAPELSSIKTITNMIFYPLRGQKIILGNLLNGEQGTIDILNRNGELVQSFQDAGPLTEWNGRNQKGDIVAAGIYLVKFPKGQKRVAVAK